MTRFIHHIAYGLAALAVLLGTSSCLEKYPESSIPEDEAMQTFNDAEQHLTGIYASLLSPNLHSGLLTLLPDIQTDMVYAVEGNTNTYGNFWRWEIRSTDSEIEAVYGTLYAIIGDCNFYLDRIDRVLAAQTDDEKIDKLEEYTGEVYAIRALCYSELLKCYCKAYDPATAKELPGVVLRTKYFEKEPLVRASLFDSYRFVLEDLARAEERLSEEKEDNPANSNYMTACTAWALHARVALYMQDWDAAIEYATKVIDSKNYSLASVKTMAPDGASVFDYMWAYDQGPEVIWRIGFTGTAYGGALGTVFLNLQKDYQYFYPDYVPGEAALAAYTTGDVRRESYFADESSGIVIGYSNSLTGPLLVKYYGNRTLLQTYLLFHVSMPKPFRLAEQYLIRAEASCRTGRYASAGSDLTTLRAARFETGGSLTVSADNWLRTIADERLRELYMEGFRLHDLKRWGAEYAAANNGTSFARTPQNCSQSEGSSLKILPDNPLFVWPIPQHELEAPGSQVTPNDSNY